VVAGRLRVFKRPLRDVPVRREPYLRMRPRVPDYFFKNPDPRPVAGHMWMHRQLENSAFHVGGVELAAKDIVHVGGRRVGPYRSEALTTGC
jgi:hypothetical protein